jgi:hypothetical protein
MISTDAPDWRRMKLSSRARNSGSTGFTTAPMRAAARNMTAASHQLGSW